MSKVISSRGTVVDFELMGIMANINANKPAPKINTTPKYYNVEQDIPYVEAISTEQFLREQLANSVVASETIEEVPVSLEIVEPTSDIVEQTLDNDVSDTITEVKNNRRK